MMRPPVLRRAQGQVLLLQERRVVLKLALSHLQPHLLTGRLLEWDGTRRCKSLPPLGGSTLLFHRRVLAKDEGTGCRALTCWRPMATSLGMSCTPDPMDLCRRRAVHNPHRHAQSHTDTHMARTEPYRHTHGQRHQLWM